MGIHNIYHIKTTISYKHGNLNYIHCYQYSFEVYLYKYLIIFYNINTIVNHVGGVIVSLLASIVVDRAIEPRSGQF